MTRVASALMVTGGLLLVWAAARAAQTPSLPQASPAVLASVASEAPQSQEISDDAARLRAWLDRPPAPPRPARNPFQFGGAAAPTPAATPPAHAATAAFAPIAPPLRLVAVVAAVPGTSDVPAAIVAANDDVRLVRVGDVLAGFTVRSITSNAVEVMNSAGVLTRLVLR